MQCSQPTAFRHKSFISRQGRAALFPAALERDVRLDAPRCASAGQRLHQNQREVFWYKNALGDNASGNAATGPVFNCHSEENHSVVPMRQFRSAARAKWIAPEGSNAGRPGLQCRHHTPSANSSVDRYRAPSSARIATMRFSAFSFRAAMTSAACSTAPELIPARTPSRQARNLAAA